MAGARPCGAVRCRCLVLRNYLSRLPRPVVGESLTQVILFLYGIVYIYTSISRRRPRARGRRLALLPSAAAQSFRLAAMPEAARRPHRAHLRLRALHSAICTYLAPGGL
jgi:hypothetical protein